MNDYFDYFDYDNYFDYDSKTMVPNPKIPRTRCVTPTLNPYTIYPYLIKSCMLNQHRTLSF